VVAVAVAQQEFCSTIPYCLLLVEVVVVVAVVDSAPGNQHQVPQDRPMPGYMQVKMVKITLAMVVAVVAVAEVGLEATVAQLVAAMLEHWQDRLG
jgi:hypothetical protein